MILATLKSTTSAASDFTVDFDLNDASSYSVEAVFSGSDVVGTFKLQKSVGGTTFIDVSGQSTSVTGSAATVLGDSIANYRFVRVNWDYTSGTGNITVKLAAKQVSNFH